MTLNMSLRISHRGSSTWLQNENEHTCDAAMQMVIIGLFEDYIEIFAVKLLLSRMKTHGKNEYLTGALNTTL